MKSVLIRFCRVIGQPVPDVDIVALLENVQLAADFPFEDIDIDVARQLF